MRSVLLCLCLLTCGCYIAPTPDTPAPQPDVVIPDDELAKWGFSRSALDMDKHPELAARLSAVMDELSKQIEHDGEQDEPKLISTTDLGIVFDRIIEYGFKGEGAYTQGVSNAVVKALDEFEPNNEARDLTDKDRRQAVQMFAALAQALREVK